MSQITTTGTRAISISWAANADTPPQPPVAIPSPTAAGRELLASCRDGCSEAIMLAHGFSIEMMVELVNAGLATATAERVVAGKRELEVARVRITDAGRRELA
jgi:hypothetical protein